MTLAYLAVLACIEPAPRHIARLPSAMASQLYVGISLDRLRAHAMDMPTNQSISSGSNEVSSVSNGVSSVSNEVSSVSNGVSLEMLEPPLDTRVSRLPMLETRRTHNLRYNPSRGPVTRSDMLEPCQHSVATWRCAGITRDFLRLALILLLGRDKMIRRVVGSAGIWQAPRHCFLAWWVDWETLSLGPKIPFELL